MFIALFTCLLMTVYAADEIPSYVHVCGVKDPNYGKCIVDNVNTIKSHICKGIPEFDIPEIEPIIIDEIEIFNTNNLKLYLKDSEIRQICDFDVISSQISPESLHFELDIIFKNIIMDSKYDVDIRLLVSLANKGLVHISADNLEGKITVDLKEEIKDGKKEIFVSKATTNLKIKNFQYEFDDSEKDMVQLHEILRNTVTENEKEIINVVKPVLEKIISELLVSVINKITYHRSEQLFPDKA